MLKGYQSKGKRTIATILSGVIVIGTTFSNDSIVNANAKMIQNAILSNSSIGGNLYTSNSNQLERILNNITTNESMTNTQAQAVTGPAITTKATGLFLTEIYSNTQANSGDSTSISKGSTIIENDPMEYIELYNSTNEDIKFNEDYSIKSVTGTAITMNTLSVDSFTGGNVIIPKNSAVLLWIYNPSTTSNQLAMKEEDFRSAHHVDANTPIYILKGFDGIHTSGALDVIDKNGVSVSRYQYTDADLEKGKSVHLRVSSIGSTMIAYKQKADPTAGVIEEEQLTYTNENVKDTIAPQLSIESISDKIQLGDSIPVLLKSNEKLKSSEISYSNVVSGVEKTASKVAMVYVGESNGVYTYQGSVTPDQLGEYHIRVSGTDEAGNISTLPADKNGYIVTVNIKDTKNAPILTCLDDSITSINEGEELNIHYSYQDDMGMQKITIYYKTSSATEYKSIDTTSFRILGKYFAMIPANELLNQDYVEYYLEGYNLYRSVKTPIKKIKINKVDDFTGIRTNLTEGQSLAGNILITAKDKKDKNVSIEIDDTKMKKVNLLEKGAFFTFSFTGNDSYYKNGVSVGNKILSYIAKWSNVMQSKAIFVDQSNFNYREDGSCEITISVWAGTQGSAFEIGNDKNNDDYKATGFHLVLTDGTVLNPDNGIDPNVVQKMGDSKGMIERLDIHYTVPADKVDALGYVWDTTLEKDGLHNVTIKSATETKKIQVRVDNTAPVITTSIHKNEKLNNECTALISLSDDTGINENETKVYLNGEILKAPYTFQGSDLIEGKNMLVVKAMDLNGNEGVQSIAFTYNNGKLVVSNMTQTGSKKDSIHLKAMLGENVKDNTKVTFYEGKSLEIGDEINVLQGSGDNTGSSVPGALGTVTTKDGAYPYQIYEMKAEGDPSDILQVKISAKASYNKPIQLYVYNVSKNGWELLKTIDEDNVKKAEFTLENHVQNNIAKVLVQARGNETIPSIEPADDKTIKNNYVWDGTGIPEQYDFSFAWITDTQYYTETWNDSFDTMNRWIVSQMNQQKIKYAIHTGDLVDEFEQSYQWECVDKNMKIFEDAGLPYGVLPGNHDVAAGNELYEYYLKYFSENRFKDSPVYGGSYKNNLGHYDLLTIDGEEMIVLYMGWDLYNSEVEWMNRILQKYSDRKAIICLHRYVDQKGKLDYTGDLVQKEVVAKNSNVFAVLDGHYHGAAINVTAFDDNHDGIKERTVYQICTDYQSADKGGSGYVKMLYFDLANNKIYMNSYSKELNDYNFFDKSKLSSYAPGVVEADLDIYELNVDFNNVEHSLVTTSMDATLYTNNAIGSTDSANGSAEIEWSGLVKDSKYGWYTAIKNNENLITRGDVSEFVFMPTVEPEPTKPDPTPTPSTPDPSSYQPTSTIPTNKSTDQEKLKPNYNVPHGLTAIYGKTLADVTLPAGFSFEEVASTLVGDVGIHKFKVTYTPSDTTKYKVVTGIEVEVTVNKAKGTFLLPKESNITKTYGDKAFRLKAQVTGEGQISYKSDNTKVAKVNKEGNIIIKGCGKAVITMNTDETNNYTSASKTITLRVKPQKAILSDITMRNEETIHIAWNKDNNVSGYEITYATNNDFSKGKKTIDVKESKTASKSISNLTKGKTYFVKIRSYKIVDGKKLYGKYSDVKKIKL
ncbi:metallophosphoesterase [Anaeromicropila herbilytica]|uniref:Fibronectin type-III domain-containing protein n=1 Tax=Anaeromicropila herbilytica TaxID=2785025 RepID=A0A7R7ID37_9FIRM|nr:metallophosphoesterase [Anaeromicropila herbilytica]BCN30619.1 hypothetical protein bsdtb5_19140 [Anaeromicropila herbilytica]